MRLKLISCEVFYREMCYAVSRSPNQVDIEFLPKGLHDIGCVGMLKRLSETLAGVDESEYDAVLFGYGLCNNGLAGLTAKSIPIVLPRAHDCITLFFGSKERYLNYFNNHPGVYFKTSGWIERGSAGDEFSQLTISHQNGMDQTYEELVEKYGEDNAKFLFDELCDTKKNYNQFTYIEMGVEPDGQFEKVAEEEAKDRGWGFEKEKGDLSMIQRLIDGQWDEKEFLVVQPGWRVVAKYDEGIIAAEKVS